MRRIVIGLSALLCVVVASESTLIKWVKLREEIKPATEHLVILAEIVKGCVCLVAWYMMVLIRGHPEEDVRTGEQAPLLPPPRPRRNSSYSDISTSSSVHDDVQVIVIQRLNSFWLFSIPALIYTVSNNITFYALSLLSSSMFSLLVNLKIPMTGLFAHVFLKKPITAMGWTALFIMFGGSVVACLKLTESAVVVTLTGFLLMCIYATCSASAAVYMEHITRHAYRDEHVLLQNVKFSFWGIVFNTLLSIARGTVLDWHLQPIHLLSIFSLVANGLVTSLVIKYAGSIAKTYASAFAALVTAFFAWVIWRQVLAWNFYLGASLCSLAILIYGWEKQRSLERVSQEAHASQTDS